MGKKGNGASTDSKESLEKEGHNLLGSPTFKELDNGRFKCQETGHELPAHARDSYAQTKHCRLGLIDAALAQNKTPLNMFNQDPQSGSKLICKLTGVTVNKSEEHIWKHINGKRFFNALDKVEAEQESGNGLKEVPDNQKPEKKKKTQVDGLEKMKKKKKQDKPIAEAISEVRDSSDKLSGSDEDDLWVPPVDSELKEQEIDDAESDGVETEERKDEARELAKRTKRVALEIGPSSYATRKKKKKTTQSS